jgi:Mn2+/Fe2+ NRAMP family transporter
MGATVMYQSGAELSSAGAVFSTQLVEMYSQTLGEWSRPIVLIAAVTTMFSTTLAIMDGFPRAIERTLSNLRSHAEEVPPQDPRSYWGSMVVLAALAVAVLIWFVGNLTTMVDFATTVSFLTAPILGYLNLKTVTSDEVAPEHRPRTAMIVLSWIGLVLLGGTGVAYLAGLI